MDRFVEQGCNLEPQMISWKQLKPIKLGVEIMNDTILEGLSFSNFIRNGPIIMFIYNRHFQYVWTNTAFQEYTGYSNEDALQMKFWEVIHPDHQGLVRTNALARQRGEKVPNSYELKILTKNGEEKWVDVFLFEEWMGDQPYVMLGAYGITERIHAQTQLQKAYDHLDQLVQERTKELTISNQALMLKEKLLMDIISNMSDGVIIISRQGEIEFINQTLKIMLGRTSVDIREQLSYEKLVADNKNLEKMLTKKQAFRDEEIVLTIEGREMQFLATGTPIEDPDGTTHKGILMLKPLAEVHRLVNRYSISPARFCFDDILTRSEIMRDTIELAKAASQNKSTILIQGESGTGKEMFAQSIHNQSRYADGPFIAVNCGAIPRELVGSELFGYVEGAFTGARKGGSPGKFELAQGGTLFLDEIGDMPLEQQAALLRVLQEKQVCRLGSSKAIPIDVRVICATNRDLYSEVQKGTIRKDLYFRLNVISLRIPPLRERPEDIDLLLKHFLVQGDPQWLEHIHAIDPVVWDLLKRYSWPGNVRELQNFAERIQFAVNDYVIRPEDLPLEIQTLYYDRETDRSITPLPLKQLNIKQQLAEVEANQIKALLIQYNGNVSRVAEALGVSRRTVDRRIKKYGLK
ncbi:MAG: sigma 54-interacting transcriptional regulator [Syntrophomonadaceae bacterium]|jgi:PAS domain S-box-containing protein|nr:sigma 54-interacting transcriptional regulator [Syntrophomonadaceae bacterium]HAA09516.1 sigma-54-dependent Fis family transcriptional regulator [Syntrophomonas sp.]